MFLGFSNHLEGYRLEENFGNHINLSHGEEEEHRKFTNEDDHYDMENKMQNQTDSYPVFHVLIQDIKEQIRAAYECIIKAKISFYQLEKTSKKSGPEPFTSHDLEVSELKMQQNPKENDRYGKSTFSAVKNQLCDIEKQLYPEPFTCPANLKAKEPLLNLEPKENEKCCNCYRSSFNTIVNKLEYLEKQLSAETLTKPLNFKAKPKSIKNKEIDKFEKEIPNTVQNLVECLGDQLCDEPFPSPYDLEENRSPLKLEPIENEKDDSCDVSILNTVKNEFELPENQLCYKPFQSNSDFEVEEFPLKSKPVETKTVKKPIIRKPRKVKGANKREKSTIGKNKFKEKPKSIRNKEIARCEEAIPNAVQNLIECLGDQSGDGPCPSPADLEEDISVSKQIDNEKDDRCDVPIFNTVKSEFEHPENQLCDETFQSLSEFEAEEFSVKSKSVEKKTVKKPIKGKPSKVKGADKSEKSTAVQDLIECLGDQSCDEQFSNPGDREEDKSLLKLEPEESEKDDKSDISILNTVKSVFEDAENQLCDEPFQSHSDLKVEGFPIKRKSRKIKCSDKSEKSTVETIKSDKHDKKSVSKCSGIKQTRTGKLENRYLCHICAKCFRHRKTLKRHIMAHNDDKPHLCSVCPRRFVKSSDLGRHMRTHTGEKSCKCNLCGKSFSVSSYMKIHMQRHMQRQTGERPYKCHLCPKAFFGKSEHRYHLLIHQEKPFACEICNKLFCHSEDRDIHVMKHKGIKPYKCDLCDKSYSRKDHVARHRKIHE